MVRPTPQKLLTWVSQNLVLLLVLCLLWAVPLMIYFNALSFIQAPSSVSVLLTPESKAWNASSEKSLGQIFDSDMLRMLDGCYHVYLDVGSNIGIQVRKLYEPAKYPDAPFLKNFDDYFGNLSARRKHKSRVADTVCAVGFEPNPHHTKILKDTEAALRRCGYNVNFMTHIGVSNKNSEAGVFFSDGDMAMKEWGGGILPPDVNNIAQAAKATHPNDNPVKILRLAEFLINVVGQRQIPPGLDADRPPTVLMKMDIEGSEIEVLPDILFSGGLGQVNGLVIEFHGWLEQQPARAKAHTKLDKILKELGEFSAMMKGHGGVFNFKIAEVDDETFGTSNLPLPEC